MAKATKKKLPVSESTTETTETAENTNTSQTGEIIEVDWENVQPVFEFKARLENLETYFSNMCLQFEKNKANLMNQIIYGQADLYSMAQKLQNSLNIDENLTYELKLPASSGEKGYFVRKE
jgi:hypothetical protein